MDNSKDHCLLYYPFYGQAGNALAIYAQGYYPEPISSTALQVCDDAFAGGAILALPCAGHRVGVLRILVQVTHCAGLPVKTEGYFSRIGAVFKPQVGDRLHKRLGNRRPGCAIARRKDDDCIAIGRKIYIPAQAMEHINQFNALFVFKRRLVSAVFAQFQLAIKSVNGRLLSRPGIG